MADPINTGEKTISGRTIWNDPETGEDYSERSTTFEINGKFYTMPTVSEDGRQHSEDQIRDYVKANGPVDYLTGEKLPEFRYMEDAIEYAVSRSSTRKQKDFMGMAKGGVSMDNQMKMFEDGGIADDGMDRDPVSGNDIPSGSLAKEVRDDIPAQLSEGEYVVPADVVRYFGVRVFEDMRMEAKMGLQKMEQNGRIGGEPISPEGPEKGLTGEDLAGLEKMLSGSGMADGGLMDKLEYTVKNDPIINSIMKEQGSPVAFAEGGVTQALSSDPKEIDQTINKFMGLARQNPTMMEELAGRGIQVNRTEATAKPKQMQQQNSPPETTNPVTKKPIEAAMGTYAVPGASYATSQTYVPTQFGTLGGSQIYQGATKVPFSGQQAPAPVNKVCPPGQIFDEKTQMCVVAPMQNQSNDDDDNSKPPPERDYTEYLNSYGSIDWSDPEAFNKYLDDVTTVKETGTENQIPGVFGLISKTVSPAINEVNALSKLKAAELIAQASGNKEATAAAQAKIETYLKKSGGFVNSFLGKGAAGNGFGFANAIFGDELKLKGLNINNWKDWEPDQVKTFQDIIATRSKPKDETLTTLEKARRGKGKIYDKSKPYELPGMAKAQKIKERRQKEGPNEKQKKADVRVKAALAKSKDPSKPNKAEKERREKFKGSISSSTTKEDKSVIDKYKGRGGRAEGGLMRRNRIK